MNVVAMGGSQRSSSSLHDVAALLLTSEIEGIYARTAAFEDVVRNLAAFI